MDWFRMYHEFASDAKVQSMSEAMQRRLMMLFCLRCSNTLVTLQDDELAFALRISVEDLSATKNIFIQKNFINDEWEILQWDDRQFVSDSSAPRVKKHRELKRAAAQKPPVEVAAASMKQECNVTLTPQNRTDTEQNRTDSEAEQNGNPAVGQPPPDEVAGIFAYWQKVMKSPGSALDDKRRSLIKRALKKYSAASICKAIRGCSRSPHNMGQNDQKTKYNGLDLILRNADKIDRFIGLDDANAKAAPGSESIEETNRRVMAELFGDVPDSDVIEMES
jgi:hypothetical protein